MSKIKILVMDVDGTLTDGKIYMGNAGEVYKVFNIKDGCGIRDILLPTKITPIIITGRNSLIVERRCKELDIHEIYQGVKNKIDVLMELLINKQIKLENVAYIGDDINDLPCMKIIKEAGGVIGCPADATKEVIEIADFVSLKDGGDGAVREYIEWILENKI
mgnify:CR=1 FL=1